MMNRLAARATSEPGPDARLKRMRILWAVFLVCVGQFTLVAWFARPEADAPAEGVPTLLYVLAALGLASVAASFVIKSGYFRGAAERQEPAEIHTGFIIAMVLCEVAALLGLVGLFLIPGAYAYGLIALGALGELMHFPRREQLMPAYYKSV